MSLIQLLKFREVETVLYKISRFENSRLEMGRFKTRYFVKHRFHFPELQKLD